MLPRIAVCVVFLGVVSVLWADPPTAKSPRQALAPLGDLIGEWRGTGTPIGTREEVQKNFWTEKMAWEWQFKGNDAWLKVVFDKSKQFTSGELHYVSDKDVYALTVITPEKEKITYTGLLRDKVLTLEREGAKESQRLVFTFLHANRFLYRFDVKPAGKALYAVRWKVGATKEGEPFAAGDGKPECVVSGGAGTTAVTYMGKTYYVCCSGCRAEFNENPAKYVKEFEAKKAKKK